MIKDYNREGFHPNDHDNTELLDFWTKRAVRSAGTVGREPEVSAPVDHDLVIIGAGFGGMGAAIEFKRLGLRQHPDRRP